MRQNGISEYRAELMAISMFAILLTHLRHRLAFTL